MKGEKNMQINENTTERHICADRHTNSKRQITNTTITATTNIIKNSNSKTTTNNNNTNKTAHETLNQNKENGGPGLNRQKHQIFHVDPELTFGYGL